MSFLRDNARWLSTGLLLALGSSFGQTYFISLFAGEIMGTFGLTDGQWGLIYTVATLTSAGLLVVFGGQADTVPLSRLAIVVALGLALAAAIMAVGWAVWTLAIAVFLLRFCGQGMMTHIKATAMARWFVATRGRAMAITNLGYPMGEALLPPIVILSVVGIGWRLTWGLAVAAILLILIPLLVVLLALDRAPKGVTEGTGGAPGLFGRHWTRGEVLRHPLFWSLIPFLLTPSFIGTVVFFHPVHVAQVKGWTLSDLAPSYGACALASVATGIAAGWLSDRLGPVRLLPVTLLPTGLAMLLIGPAEAPILWLVALIGVGVTNGMSATLSGTLMPGLFGTDNLGSVRSIATAIMVISTAIGPGITSWFIDRGVDFPDQGLAMALWCFGLSLAMVPVVVWTRRLQRGAAPV